jgi:hypothetical protein
MATTTPTRNATNASDYAATPGNGRTTTTTPVRNTPIPKPGNSRRQPTHEQIAKRAYEISISGSGGSEFDNWLRAERELRGE